MSIEKWFLLLWGIGWTMAAAIFIGRKLVREVWYWWTHP